MSITSVFFSEKKIGHCGRVLVVTKLVVREIKCFQRTKMNEKAEKFICGIVLTCSNSASLEILLIFTRKKLIHLLTKNPKLNPKLNLLLLFLYLLSLRILWFSSGSWPNNTHSFPQHSTSPPSLSSAIDL